MIYELDFTDQAKTDLALLKRNEPAAFKKATALLAELQEHPRTGTGKPEPLSGGRSGQWSRRINLKHRLIYEIEDTVIKVYVLSSYGHYDNK